MLFWRPLEELHETKCSVFVSRALMLFVFKALKKMDHVAKMLTKKQTGI